MKLSIFAKGTKLKLTKDWIVAEVSEYDSREIRASLFFAKGTVLSIHKVSLMGKKLWVSFYIPLKCCPSNPDLEQQKYFIHLKDLAGLEFDLNSKADKALNGFDSALLEIKKEIEANK